MGKNKSFSGPKAERKAGHDRFLQRLEARNRDDREADALYSAVNVRAAVAFMVATNIDDGAARSTIKQQILKNLSLGRFDADNRQKQHIIRAAREMGWQPEPPQ